jgi:hypothetical protein
MLSLPYLVGHDYFMWVDEPGPGISKKFPEDSNYGLVNEDGKSYDLLTKMFTEVNRDAGRLRREGPTKSGVVIDEPDAKKSQTIADFVKRTVSISDKSAPNPAFRFERKGDAYLATNGVVELRGKIGGGAIADEIRSQGVSLGRLNGMIQQSTGWLDINRLTSVEADIRSDAMILNVVGRFDAPPQDKSLSFELAFRLIFLPNCDWFTMEFVECRNISKSPLTLMKVYFRAYCHSGETKEAVPRLWGNINGDAWFYKNDRAFWGMAIDDASLLTVTFVLDTTGYPHPDAELTVEETLLPGQVFRPKTAAIVLSVAGKGGQDAWEAAAGKAMKTVAKKAEGASK